MMPASGVLFLPCTLDGYGPQTASVRFRCRYVAKYWLGADVYPEMRRAWTDYSVYVFQKAYLAESTRALLDWASARPGALTVLDLCDADWLQSDRHLRLLCDALSKCDLAVAPTKPIRDWLAQWTPAHVVPDRLDLAEFGESGELGQVENACSEQRDPPRLVWFGYSHNLGALEPFWPLIEARGLSLTVLSDECPPPWSDRPGVRFVRWTPEGANRVIAEHDLALVPPASPYKSNNRLLTAWALGVPAAASMADWERFFDPDFDRLAWARKRRRHVRKFYDVRTSVDEWQALLQKAFVRKRSGCIPSVGCISSEGSP